MQKTKLNILSTRPLEEEILTEASVHNIHIDCLSFIETDIVTDADITEKVSSISKKKITAVFTSMNAVEAVEKFINKKIDWDIYSIGNTTKRFIEEKFKIAIKGEADNASELADVIIKNEEKEIYFFCGDIRRDELPVKLNSAGIAVNEIVVYKTSLIQQKIEKQYDGVLFYSPSAVESFFSVNNIEANNPVLFAIGNTTASSIKKFTNNKVIISEKTGKEELVKTMISYFSKQTLSTHE